MNVKSDDDGQLLLPKWLLYAVTVSIPLFVGIFVPWAGWMSTQVITMSVRLEQVVKIDNNLSALTKRVDDKFNSDYLQLEEIKARVLRLETKKEVNK